MQTLLSTLGLTILIAGTVVHGLWTERWVPTRFVQEAAARLDDLPNQWSGWKVEPYEQDPESLAVAGAINHYSHSFTNPQTGERVLMILLCGKAPRMVVHRPEHCYRAAGYVMSASPSRVQAKGVPDATAELWTSVFTRDEIDGPNRIRIFWSWLAVEPDAIWLAPDNPRFAFAHHKALYKLYLIRNTTENNIPIENDPCIRLMESLLPKLKQTLLIL